MLRGAQRFDDLDMMVQTIIDEGDRSLFQEAVQCYQIGSNRAAVILGWSATADCLRRRIYDLAAEGDAEAQRSRDELWQFEGQSVYEEKLIGAARKCELISEYEAIALRFVRDTRSRCAHPTGVVPVAEAVRHILHVCTQAVLARRGYRGMGYIKTLVTVQFDDPFFLPNENKLEEHCREIIAKVPERLWPQFASMAAQERPGPNSEIWLRNAIAFFRVLLSRASDSDAEHIAPLFQGFEARDPDFFAVLVGIDPRVTRFWGGQRRAQARARLIQASATKITPENVHSWATICTADGMDHEDEALVERKLAAMARFLVNETDFLVAQRTSLTGLIGRMLSDSPTATQGAVGLASLVSSPLFDQRSDALEGIIVAIIERFARDQHHRVLVDRVGHWTTSMLVTFLEYTKLFLGECSDDNPDDVGIIFEAAREVVRRDPMELPPAFSEVINDVLHRQFLADWLDDESTVGQAFLHHLQLLLQQEPDAFPTIDQAAIRAVQGGQG